MSRTADKMTGELLDYGYAAELLEILPILVYERRKKLGLNLREAAEAIGVTHNTLRRLEAGLQGANTSTLIKHLQWLSREA